MIVRYIAIIMFGVCATLGFSLYKTQEKLELKIEQNSTLEANIKTLSSTIENKNEVIKQLEKENEETDKKLSENIKYSNEQNEMLSELNNEIEQLKKVEENEKYLNSTMPDDIYNRLLDFATRSEDSGSGKGSDSK